MNTVCLAGSSYVHMTEFIEEWHDIFVRVGNTWILRAPCRHVNKLVYSVQVALGARDSLFSNSTESSDDEILNPPLGS